ncbi:hypothetical protein LSTR_LSTR011524 [Laodelphax striatellus]|uniref:Uncharacterized protein n=1 Tax=Laodelphax striatellus TaxID=195883 RepID=A0A482WEH3_LAOST|nr:hypothetical protein LSTR_LSTR011524 [Laodelphax striatellus]
MEHRHHTWNTVIIHGTPSSYMEHRHHTWNTVIIHGTPSSYMEHRHHTWNTVIIHGTPSSYMEHRHHTWNTVIIHGTPDFKHFDEAAFLTDVTQTPWHQIEGLSSVDEMVAIFENFTLGLYDKHAPYVTRRINRKRRVPWMTDEILKMMGQRDKAHSKFKRTFDENSLIEYRSLRNK